MGAPKSPPQYHPAHPNIFRGCAPPGTSISLWGSQPPPPVPPRHPKNLVGVPQTPPGTPNPPDHPQTPPTGPHYLRSAIAGPEGGGRGGSAGFYTLVGPRPLPHDHAPKHASRSAPGAVQAPGLDGSKGTRRGGGGGRTPVIGPRGFGGEGEQRPQGKIGGLPPRYLGTRVCGCRSLGALALRDRVRVSSSPPHHSPAAILLYPQRAAILLPPKGTAILLPLTGAAILL